MIITRGYGKTKGGHVFVEETDSSVATAGLIEGLIDDDILIGALLLEQRDGSLVEIDEDGMVVENVIEGRL